MCSVWSRAHGEIDHLELFCVRFLLDLDTCILATSKRSFVTILIVPKRGWPLDHLAVPKQDLGGYQKRIWKFIIWSCSVHFFC